MNEPNVSARLYIAESALRCMEGTLDAVLHGNCELTTNPTFSDPAHGVWDIEHNLLRFLRCKVAEGLGKLVPSEDSYEGVKYHVGETDGVF